MNVDIQLDGLDEKIAEAVAARLLEQLPDRIAEPLRSEKTPSSEREIMGLRPFDLYPVAFVAERWDVAKDTVRKLSDEELPRAPWHGGEIRYRGLDILRYEGVDVEGLLPSNIHTLRDEDRARRSSPSSALADRSAPTDRDTSRPYNQHLPEL